MGEVDISFRRLLRKVPRPLLRLVFPGRKIVPLRPIDASVDRSRPLTTDNLFRVRAGSINAIVHVEIEREWRDSIAARLFDYATAGIALTKLPVWTVVLLLRPGGKPPLDIGVHRIPGIEGDAFVFRYHVVPIWQLDARSMRARLGLEAAPFYVAMRGADESFIQELAYQVRMTRTMTKRARKTTTELLFTVTAVILGKERHGGSTAWTGSKMIQMFGRSFASSKRRAWSKVSPKAWSRAWPKAVLKAAPRACGPRSTRCSPRARSGLVPRSAIASTVSTAALASTRG